MVWYKYIPLHPEDGEEFLFDRALRYNLPMTVDSERDIRYFKAIGRLCAEALRTLMGGVCYPVRKSYGTL